MGKSRLVYEFTHSHRLQGWLVLESASVSYGKATSYLPVIDLLKGYFKIQDRDDLREIRREGDGQAAHPRRIAEADACRRSLALLDVPSGRRRVAGARPGRSGASAPSTPCGGCCCGKRASNRPPDVFEDLHWIDTETQALLDGLVDSLPTAASPSGQLPARSTSTAGGARPITASFGSTHCRERGGVAPRCSGMTMLRPLKRVLVERRRQPLFLEAWALSEKLAGERGGYRVVRRDHSCAGHGSGRPLPGSIVFLRRKTSPDGGGDRQRSPAGACQTSQTRASTSSSVASCISRPPSSSTRRACSPSRNTPSSTPDLRGGVWGLLHERRREVHARIADAIEKIHQDRLPEHVEQLGHHAQWRVWRKGGDLSPSGGSQGGGTFGTGDDRQPPSGASRSHTSPRVETTSSKRSTFSWASPAPEWPFGNRSDERLPAHEAKSSLRISATTNGSRLVWRTWLSRIQDRRRARALELGGRALTIATGRGNLRHRRSLRHITWGGPSRSRRLSGKARSTFSLRAARWLRREQPDVLIASASNPLPSVASRVVSRTVTGQARRVRRCSRLRPALRIAEAILDRPMGPGSCTSRSWHRLPPKRRPRPRDSHAGARYRRGPGAGMRSHRAGACEHLRLCLAGRIAEGAATLRPKKPSS